MSRVDVRRSTDAQEISFIIRVSKDEARELVKLLKESDTSKDHVSYKLLLNFEELGNIYSALNYHVDDVLT